MVAVIVAYAGRLFFLWLYFLQPLPVVLGSCTLFLAFVGVDMHRHYVKASVQIFRFAPKSVYNFAIHTQLLTQVVSFSEHRRISFKFSTATWTLKKKALSFSIDVQRLSRRDEA